MSAVIQPPSDKLTKLKLLLEKTKAEFDSENAELTDWLKDRKLQVNHLSLSKEDINNQKAEIDLVEKELVEKLADEGSKDKSLASNISQEEYFSIIQKMIDLLQLPAGQLEEDSELYLEQQLSDILGFEVAAEIDNQRLLFSTGIMEGMPHLKRSPTDSLEEHTNYHEAGIARNRSAFGWFGTNHELSAESIYNEKYYIAVPLYYHQAWNHHGKELKKWFGFKKIVVINPAERIAVVGVIGDIGPSTYTRKQFGGSPELIRSGKIWSPKSAGKVLVLFVDDPQNSVPLGPIIFDQIVTQK